MATVPEFDDPGLGAIGGAFQARSKAITYHAKHWTLSREADEHERLNIDADGFHGQLRFSIWADRVVWFRLCRGTAKNGWDFLLAFNGDASGVAIDELVENLIASMTSSETQLLHTWRDVLWFRDPDRIHGYRQNIYWQKSRSEPWF